MNERTKRILCRLGDLEAQVQELTAKPRDPVTEFVAEFTSSRDKRVPLPDSEEGEKKRLAVLHHVVELEHRIEGLEEGHATPAAVRDLLDRLNSLEHRCRYIGQAEARISDLEARLRETEDIRALAADKISAEKNWRDTSKAVSRALVGATFKMRRRRQAKDKQ